MAFLFDTDAISELLRLKPHPRYLKWVKTIPREDQFTSAVCVGELFKGAFRSSAQDRHLKNIEERVLPAVTVLPFDIATARVFGEIRAELEAIGKPIGAYDVLLAGQARRHGATLVTSNAEEFGRVAGLKWEDWAVPHR